MMVLVMTVFGLVVGALLGSTSYARQRDQDPDVPAKPGTCALYYTHQHARGRSYQLTCADPQPGVLVLHVADSLKAKTVR